MIQAVRDGAALTDQELQEEVDTIMLAVNSLNDVISTADIMK
jgi:hypothetical protein